MELLLKFSNPSIIFTLPEYGSEPKMKGSLILFSSFDIIPLLGSILTKLIPGFTSTKNYNYILLFFGIPHCCWSLGRYLVSNPIGFGIKNIIFYTKLLIG